MRQIKKDYKKSITEAVWKIKKERNKESDRQVKKEYEYRWSDKSRKTLSVIEGVWKERMS